MESFWSLFQMKFCYFTWNPKNVTTYKFKSKRLEINYFWNYNLYDFFRYWLYAAISSKCLVVTNDEMRDHLFALLGTSFFPRWKEKHQVLYYYYFYGRIVIKFRWKLLFLKWIVMIWHLLFFLICWILGSSVSFKRRT